MCPTCSVFYEEKGSIAFYTFIELFRIIPGGSDMPSLSKTNGKKKKKYPFRSYLKVGKKSLLARGNSAWVKSLGLELQLPEDLIIYEDLHLLQQIQEKK